MRLCVFVFFLTNIFLRFISLLSFRLTVSSKSDHTQGQILCTLHSLKFLRLSISQLFDLPYKRTRTHTFRPANQSANQSAAFKGRDDTFTKDYILFKKKIRRRNIIETRSDINRISIRNACLWNKNFVVRKRRMCAHVNTGPPTKNYFVKMSSFFSLKI